ncbi:MAG: ABC transporter permease subunit [Clostridiaceae bacterium]|nr:ABC transporter permease subunit [Clostridiaceae bacterium]
MMLNPILEKDLKTKMRGWRMPVLLSLYLAFLGFVLYLFFLGNDLIYNRYGYSTFNPRTAVDTYNVIAVFQFSLLALIVPALTATAISGERERQTLDLMLCSGISTLSIVMGKLLVSIANIMLLVVASLPILGVVFLFGGIGIGEVLLLLLYYIITALMAASLGIFLSTLFRRNVTAIIASYICFAALAIGPVIALFIWGAFFLSRQGANAELTYAILAKILFPSPGFGFISFLAGGRNDMVGLGALFQEINRLAERETSLLRYFKPWMINSIFNIVFSCILIYLSAWKLEPVKRRRKNKREGHGKGEERGRIEERGIA